MYFKYSTSYFSLAYFFFNFTMFVHPLVDGPAIFRIGFVTFPFYGAMYLLAFFIFQVLGEYRLKKTQHFTTDEFDVFFYYSLISVIAGGCIGDILFYRLKDSLTLFFALPRYSPAMQNIWLSLAVWLLFYVLSKLTDTAPLPFGFLGIPLLLLMTGGAGMSFHGALIGTLGATLLYSYKFNKNCLDLLDFAAPLVPPGLGLGRLANFVNGELWGRPTQMPWGVIFPQVDFEPRHPSQLYECVLEGIILFMILWHFSKSKRPRGAVFGLAITLYALFRIFIEFFREPDQSIGFIAWGWLTMGQLLSFPMLLVGFYFLFNAYPIRYRSSS